MSRRSDPFWCYVDEMAEGFLKCVFCGSCSYSSRVWNAIISKVGIAIPPMRWDCLLQWVASNFHHKGKFDHMMVRQAITSSVYFLWQERNARVFNNKHKEAATISKEAMMQLRILLLHYKKPIPVRVKECWNL
ncbi:hypothetical protein OIU77_002337 [Salix suchowensis]|uniref:Reverse transcriptase zinc-binding domain-containing protein n=1 Tax=Salix suchowensis TaxID=1278906 RepID=A0ABQ9B6N8_9ROSI|nr:hypothetical protein OIU77_002337 [Salix suchowensis]